MSNDADFRGDCGRCAGLCCFALSFDRGPQFAFGKPAGEACMHLTAEHRCAIHNRLEEQGMSGCARYDCLGAGQLVTAMFAGLGWRESSGIARAMSRAFATMREIQAIRHTLGHGLIGELADLLDTVGGWSYTRLAMLDLSRVRQLAKSARQLALEQASIRAA